MKPSRTVLALATLAALAACQTTPPRNDSLERARAAVEQARSSPGVARGAAVELEQAQAALQRAETAWRDERDEGRTAHLAYLAAQRAAIAQNVGTQRESDLRLQQASAERERAQQEARARVAREGELQAQQSAQAAQVEAQQARTQAQAAQQQAQQAQAQLQAEQARAQAARQQAQQAQQQATQARRQAETQAQLQRELEDLKARNTERGMVLTLGDVLFDSGSAELKPGAQRTVNRLADVLKRHPERRVLIEGFTDSVGSEQSNLQLSKRRAEAFEEALIDRGVEEARVETHAYGEAYPVADNDSAAGRLQNRRIDIVFSDEQGRVAPR